MEVKTFEYSYNLNSNAIGFLRLVLAIFVVVQHSFVLLNQTDPLTKIKLSNFGAVGVDSFFILSGFLITASWLRSKSLPNYLWRRILRIFPAFWVCIALTAILIAPIMAFLASTEINPSFSQNQLSYIFENLGLIINQPDIANLTEGLGQHSLNGSLWTLFWEFLFYIFLAVAGLFGLLLKRKWLLVLITIIYVGCFWADSCKCTIFLKYYTSTSVAILPYFFLVGSLAFLFKKYIPDSKVLFVLAILLWIIDTRFNANYPLNPFFLSYILIWLSVHLPFKSIEYYGDFSYGIYIYHFVIIQLLLVYSPGILSPWLIFSITLPIVFGLAFLSWHLVEKRCLRLKNMFT